MTHHVLVIGSGGREHAIAKAFARSPHVTEVFVAPGNPGMSLAKNENEAPITCIPIGVDEIEGLHQFVTSHQIDLTFVGPEGPLSYGIVDAFRDYGHQIVGPSQAASQLESSKTFAKEIMAAAGVPTARYQAFKANQLTQAMTYAHSQSLPLVLKQDGLAAGKGVVIAQTWETVEETLRDMMQNQQADIVVEEFMVGEEFSVFTLVNGTHLIPLGVARDHKRAFDGDQGPNTGGMGAYAPVDWVDETILSEVYQKVITPLTQHMQSIGIPYTGVLYSGLMLTDSGVRVVEFNARFGDPETQILLPLIKSDFYEVMEAHMTQREFNIDLSADKSIGIVLAAEGYPSVYHKGMQVKWPEEFPIDQVCFAGVQEDETGNLITSGGRILMVTARSHDFNTCRKQAYNLIEKLEVANTFYRHDIGKNL